MTAKYFKPKSLTWWTGIIALLCGIIIAVGGEVPQVRPLANILSSMIDIPPAAMIAYGTGIIGMRGKDG